MTPVEVHHEAPPVNPDEVEAETQKVLQQLEVCTVNQNWKSYSKKWWAKINISSPVLTNFSYKIFNFWHFLRALSVVHPKQIQVSMLKNKTIGYTVYMHWTTWILQWTAKKLIQCQVIKKFEEIVLVQTALLVINHQRLNSIQRLASQFCVRRQTGRRHQRWKTCVIFSDLKSPNSEFCVNADIIITIVSAVAKTWAIFKT